LKVLPDAFASDPERMTRFQRGAEVLASLKHPNIAQIYGVEERALVMELVEANLKASTPGSPANLSCDLVKLNPEWNDERVWCIASPRNQHSKALGSSVNRCFLTSLKRVFAST
jgi:hypothetical protein